MKSFKSKQKKQFFVKDSDGLAIVDHQYFDELRTRSEALAIAIITYNEMISNLIKESLVNQGPFFVGRMKVQTGLQRSLDELNDRYPFLLDEMHGICRRFEGQRLYSC
jgi:hypothetical protein